MPTKLIESRRESGVSKLRFGYRSELEERKEEVKGGRGKAASELSINLEGVGTEGTPSSNEAQRGSSSGPLTEASG